MNCPEQNRCGAHDDLAYQDYLQGHSQGPAGFLMLIAGLAAVYEAMDVTSEERREAGRLLPSNPADKEESNYGNWML